MQSIKNQPQHVKISMLHDPTIYSRPEILVSPPENLSISARKS